MTDKFLLLKLKRAVWVALLEQKKITEAYSLYKTYKKDLITFRAIEKTDELVNKEIKECKKIFFDKSCEIAKKCFDAKDYTNALIGYNVIFDIKQDNKDIINKYIKCLDETGQYDLEISLTEHLQKITPDDYSLLKTLSGLYKKVKNYQKMFELIQEYMKLNSKSLTAGDYNLYACYCGDYYANVSYNNNDALKAIENFKTAVKMDKKQNFYIRNVIIASTRINDDKTCKEYMKKLFKQEKVTPEDEFSYSIYSLKMRDFESWNKYFDSRFKKDKPVPFPKMSKPQWDGKKDLSNSTLLIHFEQGYGDTFLMYGYVPRLQNLAKHIIFVTQNGTEELFKDNNYGMEIIPQKEAKLDKLKYDYYLPTMSIPTTLKVTKDNISVGGGYIKANKELVKKFKDKYFKNNKFKIGISFQGNPNCSQIRDIPIKDFLPFDNLKNIQLYSLTKNPNVKDEDFECFKNNKVINIAKDFSNFADTAAAIENLDIVVTSDNCILNLAGALGKKTIGLFNTDYFYRWYKLEGEDCGWFTSVKPIVNDKFNNWKYSINLALDEIKKIRG